MDVTTPGQLLISEALPEDVRKPEYDIDGKSIKALMQEVADKHPDQYRDVAQKLMTLGHYGGRSLGMSLSLRSLLPGPAVESALVDLRKRVAAISDSDLSDDEKDKQIEKIVGEASPVIKDMVMAEGKKANSPLATQAGSGSRGNATQLMQIIAGDMLVTDHRDRIISTPILHGYAEGLDPAEYWAGSYGARLGSISTKLGTQAAGYLSKQTNQATHRLVVTEDDCGTQNGISVSPDDRDDVGAVLAVDAGGLKAGTILTSNNLKGLKNLKQITIRSVMTCQSRDGVCAKCAGVREKGRLPSIGDNIGLPSGQAISERISQSLLGAKHVGGAVGGGGPSQAGFKYLNSLIQAQEDAPGSATLATLDGSVQAIRESPQGGHDVIINDEPHYIPPDMGVTSKVGDIVEAGDQLSDGLPSPAEITHYKGLGEGRRVFLAAMMSGLKNSGVSAHRRNVETLARAMVNHIRITAPEGFEGYLPDDILTYDELARIYQPREGSKPTTVATSLNRYLEKPALHYTVGTRVTPSVQKRLKEAGYNDLETHEDPPPFEPLEVRGMEMSLRDPNFLTRMGGSHLSKGFLEAVHRGRTAPTHDTSFIPSLVRGDSFGDSLGTEGKY